MRTARTSIGGNYRLDDVEVGGVYIITVFAGRFTFSQPAQIVSAFDETGNIDFIADN